MKKVLAIFLSILCVCSMFTVLASASSILGNESEEESTTYCITYEKETLANVKMMYKPTSTYRFDGPGEVAVTKDVPIAIDHDFICWRDADDNLYYEGDKIYVDGEITLYAVWGEKTDNDPYILRLLKAVVLTFQRMLNKALGIFKDMQDFESSYVPSTEELTTTAIHLGQEVS